MKKILLLSGLVLLSLWMIRCKDSLEDTTFVTFEGQPVGVYLESQPEYSDWVTLLKKTNLFNALNISKTKFTCFVADNDAMQAYLVSKNYHSIDDIPLKDATYLMRYHIVPGNAYTHSSFAGQIPDTTASGDYLTIKYRTGGINAMYVNDTALIIRKDITALNGYIHKIDRLLDPITISVWDIINGNENYSIFREAIKLCELEQWMQSRNKTINQATIRDYKTVFIPSDETFKAAGIQSVEDLKQRYPGEDYTSTTSPFQKFITYHIINSYTDFSQLSDFGTAAKKLKNLNVVAPNELLSVEEVSKKIILNRHSDSVCLVSSRYDQQANNGYVHEINHIMPISPAKPATVIWDFCDIDACRVLEMYGKYDVPYSMKKYPLDRENAKDIEWFTVPDNNEAVVYQLRDEPYNKPSHDLLFLDLGYVGWVKIKTPTIAQGKYKVTIYKIAWGDRGKCQMYIDDNKFGPQLDFGSNGGATNLELGTLTFQNTSRHIVKFAAQKKGSMEVDRLVFEPVNE